MPENHRTNRINITLPVDWERVFRQVSAASGQSLSEWLRDAGRAQLPESAQTQLSKPARAG